MKRLRYIGAVAAAGMVAIILPGRCAGQDPSSSRLEGGTTTRQADDLAIEGKAVGEWLKQLRGENRGLQMRAARALAEAPTNARPKIIEQIVPVLKSKRENDRFVAAQVLGECGAAARSAVPELLPVLEGTEYERNRAAAAKALGQILADVEPSEEVEKVTQALIKLFEDRYVDVRREAVEACGKIGLAAKACIPHLSRPMEDVKYQPEGDGSANKDVHAAAAWTAGRMGKLSVQHIDLLIAMLHRENRNHRVSAEVVTAIGRIGAVHKNVVPNVLRSLEKVVAEGTFNWPVRVTLAKAHFATLKGFGSQAIAGGTDMMVRLVSEEGLRPGWEFLAVGAMEVLATIGPPAAETAVPAIEKHHANSKNVELKKAAEATLRALKGP